MLVRSVLARKVALQNVQCVLVRGIERVGWVNPERVVLPAASILDVRVQKLLPVQQVCGCEANQVGRPPVELSVSEWDAQASVCCVPWSALASPSVMDIALSISRLVDRDWSFCWDAASDCVGNVLVVVTVFVCEA